MSSAVEEGPHDKIVFIHPKHEIQKHRGIEYTISYDVVTKTWRWQFELNNPMRFGGDAHTFAAANAEAKQHIDLTHGVGCE